MIGFSAKIIERPPSAEKIAKNIDFGTAVGLTRTAKAGQAAVVSALHGAFTLRGRWFEQQNRFGIKVKPATKIDLAAEVRTMADWLVPHEEGKAKTPTSGQNVAVPTDQVRRNKRMIIPRAQRPRGLGAKAFVLQTKHGPVLAQRISRGPRKGIVVLYGLERSVRIRKQSTFYEPIDKVVKRDKGRNILEGIDYAISTMK